MRSGGAALRKARAATGEPAVCVTVTAGGTAGGLVLAATSHPYVAFAVTGLGLLVTIVAAVPYLFREQRHRHLVELLDQAIQRTVVEAAVDRLDGDGDGLLVLLSLTAKGRPHGLAELRATLAGRRDRPQYPPLSVVRPDRRR